MKTVSLIRGGQIYDPEPLIGSPDILCINGKIVGIGQYEVSALDALDLDYEVIDAKGARVLPGLIDPHQHLLGGSGEKGFATQTPELTLTEQIEGGITTVVGCLGVDTYTRNMPALLAKAKAFNEEGMSAYVYSGGYDNPPKTLTGSIRTDLILVKEVIGTGETAISDSRSFCGCHDEVARLVMDGYAGGILSQKSGVTHFHVGNAARDLQLLHSLLDDYPIHPESIYPTHVQRTAGCLKSAIELTRKGVTCDMDTEERDLAKSVSEILAASGNLKFFTISTDASFSSPSTLFLQLQDALQELKLPLEKLLPMATRNTARVLGLKSKGRVEVGADADLLIIENNYSIRDLLMNGRRMVKEGTLNFQPRSLEASNRKIELYGQEKGFSLR